MRSRYIKDLEKTIIEKEQVHKKKRRENPMQRLYAIIFFTLIAIYMFQAYKDPIVNNDVESLYINGEEVALQYDLIKKIDEENSDESVVLMSTEDIKELFDQNISVSDDGQVILTSDINVAKLWTDQKKINLNGILKDVPASPVVQRHRVYIPLHILKEIYQFDLNIGRKNVAIFTKSMNKQLIKISQRSRLKSSKSIFSSTITELNPEKLYIYLGEYGNSIRLMTNDVYIGYVSKKYMDSIIEKEGIPEKKLNNEQIHLVTNYDNYKENFDLVEKSSDKKNACLIDLFLLDKEGNISEKYAVDNNGYEIYDQKIQKEGMIKVGKVSLSKENSDIFKNKLINFEDRVEIIKKIVQKVDKYSLGGIYLDVYDIIDKAAYTRLIIELRPYLNAKNAILMVPKNTIDDVDKCVADYCI